MDRINLFLDKVKKIQIEDDSNVREELLFKYSVLLSLFVEILEEMEECLELREMVAILDDLYHKLPNAELFYIVRYKYFNQQKFLSDKIMEAILSVINAHEYKVECKREKHLPTALDEKFMRDVGTVGLACISFDEFVDLLIEMVLDNEIENFVNRQLALEKFGFLQIEDLDGSKGCVLGEVVNLVSLLDKLISGLEFENAVKKIHEMYHKIPGRIFVCALELIESVENFDDIENFHKIRELLCLMWDMHDKKAANAECYCYKIKRG